MSIGLITNPTTPIPVGTVATPSFASNVEDNVNALLTATNRSKVVSVYSAKWIASGGAIGGWGDAGGSPGQGIAQSTAATSWMQFPIELFFGTSAGGAAPASSQSGSSPTLISVKVRVKPAGTGVMTARIFSINNINSTSSPTTTNVSSLVSSDGTSNEQILTLTATSPPVIDGTSEYFCTVTCGNSSDRVYAMTINYSGAAL